MSFDTDLMQQRIADLALTLPGPEARELWARITAPGFFCPDTAREILAERDTAARLARWSVQQQGRRPRGRREA